MNNVSEQEALYFIMRLTGGIQHIAIIGARLHEVLLDYNTHHLLCHSNSLHWWEEVRLINGEVIAVGGEINHPASTADLLTLVR